MTTFFTSDTHYGHTNILKYCSRPFSSVEEMNEKLIENWNSVVKPGDTVYHLGDFAFCDPLPILDRLNGVGGLHLILGNHDRKSHHKKWGKWNWIKKEHMLDIDGQLIFLNHYPEKTWPKMDEGVWRLFGHSHGGTAPYGLSFDVGVDCWNYFPISFEQVKAKMDEQPFIGKPNEL